MPLQFLIAHWTTNTHEKTLDKATIKERIMNVVVDLWDNWDSMIQVFLSSSTSNEKNSASFTFQKNMNKLKGLFRIYSKNENNIEHLDSIFREIIVFHTEMIMKDVNGEFDWFVYAENKDKIECLFIEILDKIQNLKIKYTV